MPASPCLSAFSLSVVGNYADENESAESRLVSLGRSDDKRAGGNARPFVMAAVFFGRRTRKSFFEKPLDKRFSLCYNQVNR